MTHAKIALHARAAQIEIAILEPKILVDGFVGVDCETAAPRSD